MTELPSFFCSCVHPILGPELRDSMGAIMCGRCFKPMTTFRLRAEGLLEAATGQLAISGLEDPPDV